jgi:hypothetical protein
MSADRFDDLDRALASGLASLAPEVSGGDETLAALRPRFERARTRRRIAKASVTTLCLLLVGALAALAAPGTSRSKVTVSGAPTTAKPPGHKVRPSTTTVPKKAPRTTTPTVSSPTTIGIGIGGGGSSTHHSGGGGSVSVPVTSPGGQGQGGGGLTATTIPPLPSDVKRYYSHGGGSILVRVSRGGLSLVAIDPQPGFRAHVKDRSSDEIRIRFSKGDRSYEVDVRLNEGVVQFHEHD